MKPTQYITITIWHDKLDDEIRYRWCYLPKKEEAWAHAAYMDGYLDALCANWPNRISRIANSWMHVDAFAKLKVTDQKFDTLGIKEAIRREMLNPKPENFATHP